MAKALNWNQVTGFGPPLCFRNDLTLQRPALPRSLKLLIPGKLARGPGANPQTKSETSARLERLLVGAFPPPSSHRPHPLPSVSRAVP